ncbi:hypothetical protein B0T22DRAFT_502430 [Podospora appendiculata]|uniref:WKF domain-containing protein n=1 Tax=Podospora appendiculata TaxID=314037 RepID=A0AAE0WZZ0_9PEZI|nr:hypothetical protein B0T22DRAFT_502430 [Podospora appendiculata]
MSVARVPAWKRLGLKLKGPGSGEDQPASSPSSTTTTTTTTQPPNVHPSRVIGADALKRKQSNQQQQQETPNKRFRRDDNFGAPDQSFRRNDYNNFNSKSVSFTEDTKVDDAAAAPAKKKPKKPKKKKVPKEPSANETPAKADFSLEPALAYLRQWHTARDAWKFNKNHQTLLIKYLFDASKVPSSDISVFYTYIRDLKGAVRSRLRETATEVKKKDMEQGAAASFPATVALEDKQAKQTQYDTVISEFIAEQRERQVTGATGSTVNANGKRSFDEVEFVLRTADPEIKQRLLKRIRAEMVLEELSDSESTTSSADDEQEIVHPRAAAAAAAAAAAPATRSTDGSQPTKRRRLRNVRTEIDSSSDSDSSDSDSCESSSSDSDDDEDEDEEMTSSSSSEPGSDESGDDSDDE